MSNRFHNKWHRHNHHTISLSGEPDSSHDPIASPDDPFLGTFCLSGALSATSVSAADMHVSNFFASSATFEVVDMVISELSGFQIKGNDIRTEPPLIINPTTETLLVLSGAGIWSENWGHFNGSVSVGGNITATNIVALGNLEVTGSINYGAVRMASSYYTAPSTVSTDLSTGDIFTVTITGNTLLANPTNGINGKAYTWWVYQDGTGSHSVSTDTLFKAPSSATIPLAWSVSANAMDMLSVRYSSNANLYYIVAFVPGY